MYDPRNKPLLAMAGNQPAVEDGPDRASYLDCAFLTWSQFASAQGSDTRNRHRSEVGEEQGCQRRFGVMAS
jgi:hypothetical protein